MRIALDTNILAYASGLILTPADIPKGHTTHVLLAGLASHTRVVALQALSELHQILVRKGQQAPATAAQSVSGWISQMELVPTDASVFASALQLTAVHRLQIFDAIILAAAAEAGCDILVSEDMADGFAWRGVTVVNPFGPRPDARIAALLP